MRCLTSPLFSLQKKSGRSALNPGYLVTLPTNIKVYDATPMGLPVVPAPRRLILPATALTFHRLVSPPNAKRSKSPENYAKARQGQKQCFP